MALFLGLLMQEVMEAMMPGGALHTWRRWGLALVAAAGGIVGAGADVSRLRPVRIRGRAVGGLAGRLRR